MMIGAKQYFRPLPVFLLWLLLLCLAGSSISYAKDISAQNDDWPSLAYYDADFIYGNKDTGDLIFEDNASFLLGNLYISAKKIVIIKNENLMTAEGNVKLIYSKQKATASKIVIDLNTKQIRMDQAKIFSDPTSTEDFITKEAFGLSKAEIVFDENRRIREEEIQNQLKLLRQDYVNLKNLQDIKPQDKATRQKLQDVVLRYGQLLARYKRTQYQPNAYLAAIPEKEREQFLARRSYLENFHRQHHENLGDIANFNPIPGFIHIEADEILQKNSQTFILKNAAITPCQCSSLGEPPLFRFSSKNSQIDIGNYITMQGTTIDIFSVPSFYIPWFKLSIKNKRETGFLYPGAYTSNNAGSAMSVPFFITLGDHADSTITYRNFSLRGSQAEVEWRAQLNGETPGPKDTTQFYSLSQYIQDQKYSLDWGNNRDKIRAQSNPQAYASFQGNDTPKRWYHQDSFSLPISYWGSLKANGQFVSDNTYLSDFSSNTTIDPKTAVKGNTTSSAKRFLEQEVQTEYYGSDTVFSVRLQGQKDLFSPSIANTPIRAPRFEFSLLPKRYLGSVLVFNNTTSFDVIRKLGNDDNFLVTKPLQNSTQTDVVQTVPPHMDSRYPYVQGERLFSTSRVSLPLLINRYISSYAAAVGAGTQYFFPQTIGTPSRRPYQAYMQYILNVDMPLFARHDFYDAQNHPTGNATAQLNPYVNFAYIPSTYKSPFFPTAYNQWYAQDSSTEQIMTASGGFIDRKELAKSAYLTLGFNSSWNIKNQHYELQNQPVQRFLRKEEPKVGDFKHLLAVAEKKGLKTTDDPQSVFQLSAETEANKVFEQWAQTELQAYYQEVQYEDFQEKYVWPSKGYYTLIDDAAWTPLTFGMNTNYNFMAKQTARELDENVGFDSNIAPYPVMPFGNINSTLGWNLQPYVPLNGSLSTSWSQVYKRIVDENASFGLFLPFHLDLHYSHRLQYVLATSTTSTGFVQKTQDAAEVNYAPKQWIVLSTKWSYEVDPTAEHVNTDYGRAYATAYSVTLLGIQRCLDLVLSRTKIAGNPENQATYAVGLNLQLFGFESQRYDVGDYLNRKMQGY